MLPLYNYTTYYMYPEALSIFFQKHSCLWTLTSKWLLMFIVIAKDINHIGSLSEEKKEDVLTAVITN